MTIDKVIELGKSIQKPKYHIFHNFTATTWLAVILLFMLAVLDFIVSKKTDDGIGELFVLFVLIALGIILYNVMTVEEAENTEFEKQVEKWRETIALPYIGGLAREKKEVVFIKIDPELAVQSIRFSENTYTRENQRTPVSISYKDDGIVTEIVWIETRMELTEEEKPFVEYQRLVKDLGHGVEAGNYNHKITIPDSYTFTEFK